MESMRSVTLGSLLSNQEIASIRKVDINPDTLLPNLTWHELNEMFTIITLEKAKQLGRSTIVGFVTMELTLRCRDLKAKPTT